ncbi:helix-turn-helix domain-containing protein [Algimonas porphyrae]|uniref:Transcriptional regulator n=1 Tax=Algimonas porphyrae TaxID=1128113 RepID=A0ABQ5UV11_9PROT|nr:XRE family transcriptional regulator [Algimonas porphyrae]GLQ19099.1 transcriptional regulator [Algimonas porphyrae]
MPRKARSKRQPCPQTEALSGKLGETIARLRKADQLSLGELSDMSGVAKSMISQIEKNESNPTVATLSRLSQALGTSVEAMFAADATETALVQHARVQDIPRIISDDGLCELRIIGALETVQFVQVYDFRAEAGGKLVSSPHPDGSVENLTLLAGELEVRVDEERWILNVGETLRYRADRPHSIHNPGKTPAHATMVNILAHAVRPG